MIPISTNLHLNNSSKLVDENLWEWSVWLEGPSEEIENVEAVTYRLHPSFLNPTRRITDRSNAFKLSSAGWGEFAITAEIQFKDGAPARIERWLELKDPSVTPSSGESRPTVFLSYSIADNMMVQTLSKGLKDQGLDVWTDQTFEGGMDFPEEIGRCLKNADVVVPVISDPRSTFVEEQAMIAKSAGRNVLPIVIGQASLPSSLDGLLHVRLNEPRNMAGLADQVVARVKDLILPEEG
jgi:hypothetical protein